MPVEYLIVGLGNPGEEYENTPHNLGFMVIDRLAESHAIRVRRKENTSLVGLGEIGGKRVALAKPQTYMNLSGPAVNGLLERYELKPDRLIVVYDELDLPWGSLRIRLKGSAAGQADSAEECATHHSPHGAAVGHPRSSRGGHVAGLGTVRGPGT